MEGMGSILTSLYANAKFVKYICRIQIDKSSMPDIFSNHLEWYLSKAKSILSKSVEVEMDKEKRIINPVFVCFCFSDENPVFGWDDL